VAPAPLPDHPLTPVERRAFDYSELEHWMAHADQAIQRTRRALQALANPKIEPAPSVPQSGVAMPAANAPEPGHADDRMEHHV
jgi:hypothetical protein